MLLLVVCGCGCGGTHIHGGNRASAATLLAHLASYIHKMNYVHFRSGAAGRISQAGYGAMNYLPASAIHPWGNSPRAKPLTPVMHMAHLIEFLHFKLSLQVRKKQPSHTCNDYILHPVRQQP